MLRDSHLPSQMSLWSCSHIMSCAQMKTLHLYFYENYKHQTYHRGELGLGLQDTTSRDKLKTLDIH